MYKNKGVEALCDSMTFFARCCKEHENLSERGTFHILTNRLSRRKTGQCVSYSVKKLNKLIH